MHRLLQIVVIKPFDKKVKYWFFITEMFSILAGQAATVAHELNYANHFRLSSQHICGGAVRSVTEYENLNFGIG